MQLNPPICPECQGVGLRRVIDADGQYKGMEPCICAQRRKMEAAIQAARIPEHYRSASFDAFKPGKNPSLQFAAGAARRYVHDYTPGQPDGLLFTGTVGTGKTHLASATLREIIARGFDGYFADVRELLKALQTSYGNHAELTEQQILAPVLSRRLVVLDELGAARATDWTAEIMEHIINTRYNKDHATIITTNYPFHPPAAADLRANGEGYARVHPSTRGETLGDRIGARVFSRLQEMVTVIEMSGDDYRGRHKP